MTASSPPVPGHATIADGGDVAEILSHGASITVGTPNEIKTFFKPTDEATAEEDEDDARWTTWEILCTIYLPILLIWLRRSMFGTAHVIRSLLWGQFLRLLVEYIGTQQERSGSGGWLLNRVTPWIQPWLEQQQQQQHHHHHHKAAEATFPPALTALAILAFMLCVVHPDGFTWIMLGKLRDGIMAFVHSSATCWATAMHDYGIIPTVFASLTLAALGCLAGIIIRTLSPKTCPNKRQPKSEKHKKKKRGKHHHSKRHGHHGKRHSRSTTTTTSTVTTPTSKAIPENEPCTEEPIETNSPTSSIAKATEVEPVTTKDEDFGKGQDAVLPDSATTIGNNVLADDHSCDDTGSVRSFGSAPTAVTISSEASMRSGSVETGTKTRPRGSKASGRQLHGSKKHGKKLSLENGDGSTSPEKTNSRLKNLQQRPINSRAAELKKAPSHRRGGQKKSKSTTNQRLATTISASPFTPAAATSPVPDLQPESSFFSSPTTNTISPYARPFVPASHRTQQQLQRSPVQQPPKQEPAVSPFSGGLGPIGVNATSSADASSWWTASTQSPSVKKESQTFVRPPPGLEPIGSAPKSTELPFFPSPPRPVETTATGSFSATYNTTCMNDSLAPYGYGDGALLHSGGNHLHKQEDEESRIEAELQELGGQMVGSVLDF